MRSCYVSIPFGIKNGFGGQTLDFDYLYQKIIQPAVQELQMECRRIDEFSPDSMWQKSLFTELISSDLMIADISTHSASVLYELGVRHSLKRGRTLLLSATGPLPGILGYSRMLWYEPDESGRLTGEPAWKFREALMANIRQSQRSIIRDSPIYEFFPDIQVMLPPELESQRRTTRAPSARDRRGFAQNVLESPAQAMGNLQKWEEEVRSTPEVDPVEYFNLLRKYRDMSQWNQVIALAKDAPSAIASSPEVLQLLALALNRRGETGDKEQAISLMEHLVADTGGDGETFGILGRIYKDLYELAKVRNDAGGAAENHERALQHYRAGFEKNPKDYYPGINVVTLLLQRDDAATRAELDAIVPRVRAAVQEKGEAGPLDFWDLATKLQLAVVARDWSEAEEVARMAVAKAPPPWMLKSTLDGLRAAGERLTDAADRIHFKSIFDILRQAGAPEETEP